MIRIGAVPYVNAKPLVRAFETHALSGVEVAFEVPSRLPSMLDAGEAVAVMASSFDALRTPGRWVADEVSISSLGEAESVRLFSKVPFERIETLALDQSSLTSNGLVRVLLAERFGVRPEARPEAPDLEAMLAQYDAALLIGDKGMLADEADLRVLDLGAAWNEWTGLPFVWALWIGRDEPQPEVAEALRHARAWGEAFTLRFSDEVAFAAGWDPDRCRRYLTETMNYRLTPSHREAFRLFGERLVANGLLAHAHEPTFV
ncbi:MAG: menaquinone biosynthesis protein [Fimbriimonadaceae bacterium]|nr:menaquinone biosynthesis protein [Fimbriimonadaceae bacterium]